MITAPLIVLLQDNEKGRKSRRLTLTNKEQAIFHYLLIAFQSVPLLKHYNLNLLIKVEIDTSKFTIVDIFF